ncbi:LLM class flavin-dependent oxidoreductase [Micromonospora sp. WMMD812]|uniref:LLM class flavin-dependent oxidoreductase n=1 Tax=Micromonospora sp. WMMD812 TaxID=3015152 RepID=UPI00248C72FB|nr:LLM class flavin-dependent oxidoreductase [Micromonospora sp. WMMD812]WBB65234.1 LLM class flavin-dependent oxidoreductase [Micromonospora sp. WMMD812]
MSGTYRHRLEFGTFVTPVNATPDAPVALARRSEELGYDLVTFQDHPYQPAFLDTWTLLSWVAGKTERIHLAANVLNLPLRSPAVLARSAASLDLLSDGRLDLALGAGAFWPAIEAMGGRRRSPGEAVDALAEAIDVIRALLDAGEPTPVRYAGEHYRLDGAQPGPLPAHHIPIWLGAYRPRMLRLVGAKADGWLPTLGPIGPGDLRAGNETIDEAAREAGRDPAEIRRLLNISGRFAPTRRGLLDGPAESWVEDLLPLVVEDGIGTLILMTDDPDTMERFAHEVAPALREAVDRQLPEPLPTTARRSVTVRAKRRPGIAYDQVPASLADTAVEPGDVGYPRVKSTYLRGGAPGLVLRPRTPAEVADALAFAREHRHLPLGVRSGGHGISGRSTNDGGIVISLARMNDIEVLDESTRRVRIGPGARWMDVAAALEPHGWALTSGDYGGVGVGGLATAGGVGWLARKHGLTIDHLRAVELVLADGTPVRASDTENPDLFWAVRGAGANFGVVTAFEFEVDEVGPVGWAQFVLDASDPAGLLARWGAAVEAAPRDLTSALLMGPPRLGQPSVAQVMAMVDSDDPATIVAALQPVADIAPGYDQQVVITSYASVLANASEGPHHGQGEPISRTGLIEHLTPDFATAAARLLASGEVFFFHIRSVGGAVTDVDPDAMAWSHRRVNFHVSAFGRHRDRLDALWDGLLAGHLRGTYLSFETDQRPERLAEAFPPRTLARLRTLKERYDPDGLFRDNFAITPDSASRTTS